MKLSGIYMIMISILVLILVFAACTGTDKSTSGSNEPVDFSVSNLEGETVTLSEYRGKVVVLDFWATWCRPCLTEIPTFNRINRNYSDNSDFAILTIASESGDAEDLAEFIENKGIEYPVLIGNRKVLRDFGVPGFPTTLIIDKEGKIAARLIGSRPNLYRLITGEIERLLAL